MQAELIERVEVAPGLGHFVFEARDEGFEFLPGQFVSLTAEIGAKQITRAYSLASALLYTFWPRKNEQQEKNNGRGGEGHR